MQSQKTRKEKGLHLHKHQREKAHWTAFEVLYKVRRKTGHAAISGESPEIFMDNFG